MATEDSSGTAAQTRVRTTNAGTHEAFIVALLLRAILAGLIHLQSLQGTEPPRTTARIMGKMGAARQTACRLAKVVEEYAVIQELFVSHPA
jgi:hypothetical protein